MKQDKSRKITSGNRGVLCDFTFQTRVCIIKGRAQMSADMSVRMLQIYYADIAEKKQEK